ncbi:energy transducer TonB [Collimonas humicola]|uniref:energy transducer TonB family protein n=1 Tax=Collimonas humicola TaxID=2825886 RepID=UPI001B8D540A|nr:energy transducer TonB [Collimonas humicola]
MNARIHLGLYCGAALLLAACNLIPGQAPPPPVPATTPNATSTATTLDDYKRGLAQRIVAVNSTEVYVGRPQALLRAVIVVKYYVNADGQLLRAEILRSNKDRTAEASALAAVRRAAPFPKPDSKFLRRGEVEIAESWLFNDDGRFQLRSVAEQQMDQ